MAESSSMPGKEMGNTTERAQPVTSEEDKQNNKRLGIKEFIITLIIIALVWAGRQFFSVNLLTDKSSSLHQTSTTVTVPESTAIIKVLFTSPQCPDHISYHYGGFDEDLAAAIDAALHTVDVAAYKFDLETVADALVRADKRGVVVRLVTDSDYEKELGPERLRKARIKFVADDLEPFMHNKFVIIDANQVWTGSWNLTDSGTYRNNNNILVIHSPRLAENYTVEFEEMFVDKQFGATSPDDTPYPEINLNGVRIENVFESEGKARDRIIELIRGAKSSVAFMAFVFTDDDIANAMIDKGREGLEVSGIIETRNVEATGSAFLRLLRARVEVIEDGNPYIMHHNVILIDNAIVITGSYNFSSSAADYNDENLLIMHSPEVGAQYRAEYDKLFQQALEEEYAEED